MMLVLSMISLQKINFYPTAAQLSSIVATYRGKQPCADCPGIDSILTLNSDSTYVQKSVYLERNNTLEEKGTWVIIKGKSEGTKILQLTSMGNENKTYYLISDSQLVPLDSDLGPLPSPYNAPLMRQ
jgi:copper homeostasis protein (lipoprotein)